MNTQRKANIEQQHRNTVRDITETLLRILAPQDINDWLFLDYLELLEYAMKALGQEYADLSEEKL